MLVCHHLSLPNEAQNQEGSYSSKGRVHEKIRNKQDYKNKGRHSEDYLGLRVLCLICWPEHINISAIFEFNYYDLL